LTALIVIVSFLFGVFLQKSLNTEKSISPYLNVNVMPFNPDGWYKNSK
jgi:hypothetical protein